MYRLLSGLLAFVFYFSVISPTMAQDTTRHRGVGVEANFLVGRIIKHSVKFTAPVPPVSIATDVNFVWQTYGKKEWNQRQGFPVTGLGITFTDYCSKRIFGSCLGVYPNLQVPIV